jgi:hypothetical protein
LSHIRAGIAHICFRIQLASSTTLSHSFDLILHFLEDRCWSCRHAVEVLHVQLCEFVTEIFLDGFDKEVQVSHVVHDLAAIG